MAGKAISLAELQTEYHKVTDDKIVPGALIRTILSKDEDLVFKGDRREKPKRLIVIGTDKVKRLCYGSVLVNTYPNPQANFSKQYLEGQYIIKKANYDNFLDYDSFADCAELLSIPIEKLKNGEFFGYLNETDWNSITQKLKTSKTISTNEKYRFGIL